MRMLFTIVDRTKIPQSGSTEQFGRIWHFRENQNIKVCQVCVMGCSHKSTVKLHDAFVDLAADLLCMEGPTFQTIQEFT